MAAHGPPGKKWNFKEIQHILSQKASQQDSGPVLKVDILAIRDRLARYRNTPTAAEPPTKSARTPPIHATVSLTIWIAASSSQETLVEQTKRCTIERRAKAPGERYATVTLDEPFLIPVDQLRIDPKKIYPLHEEQTFSMQLVLTATSLGDEWPPVDMRKGQPRKKHMVDAGGLIRFPLLCSKWQRLPHCPETEQESLLDMTATQDNIPFKPRLSLQIAADWCERPSPLTLTNQEFKDRLSVPRSSVPSRTSPASCEDSFPKVVAGTYWEFEGLSDLLPEKFWDGWVCALCNNRKFTDITLLHFHIKNYHDLFKFEWQPEFSTNDFGQSLVDVKIKATVVTDRKGREADPDKDPRELNEQCFRTPFDLERYLRGDRDPKSGPKKTAFNRPGNDLTPQSRTEGSKSSSREPARLETDIRAEARPVEQIPDLEPPRKKRFTVPPAPPDMQFYRLHSKRVVQPGEVLSESDDEVDQAWLQRRHTAALASQPGLRPPERRFLRRYDRHMLAEAPSSTVHQAEAVVRFCRANAAWLARQPRIRLEFHRKAAQLRLQGLLTWVTIGACCSIISDAGVAGLGGGEPMDLDAVSSEEEPSQEPAEAPFGHLYGRCGDCLGAVRDLRSSTRCAHPRCETPEHHLSCIGGEAKIMGWICTRCRENRVTAADLPARIRSKARTSEPTQTAPSVATPVTHPPADLEGTELEPHSTRSKTRTATAKVVKIEGPEDPPASPPSPRPIRTARKQESIALLGKSPAAKDTTRLSLPNTPTVATLVAPVEATSADRLLARLPKDGESRRRSSGFSMFPNLKTVARK